MNKPRRKCIFCDNFATSKEHIWPQWMHSLIRPDVAPTYNRHTINRSPNGEEQIEGPTGKPGSVYNIQVRAVCANCNNGWMSARENEVRPFLEPMVKGEPITATHLQIESLARWCAQKFIVMEHAAHGTSVTPRADRIEFKANGTIPHYFRIYVGNHNSKTFSASIRHSHVMALTESGPSPPLDGTDRNIQTISLIAGRLFFHLNAARIDRFEIETANLIPRVWGECRIWPNPNASLKWPHRPLLSNEGLSLVGNCLESIFQSGNAKWLEALPTQP